MRMECDVLVVGAGPAGTSAARAAAQSGVKTILIEKKNTPGKAACGETISKAQIQMLPFEMPSRFLKWYLEGFFFKAEDIEIVKKGDVLWEAYTIERKEFEPWLAKMAVDEGANFLPNTELINFVHEDFYVMKVFATSPKGQIEIIPKLIVDAEGLDSKIIETLGIKKLNKWSIGNVCSYEMGNLQLEKPHLGTVYLGEYAEGGYGYILPKSNDKANVGVGSSKSGVNIQKCFEEFINIPEIKKQVKNGKKIVDRSGKAPIQYTIDNWNYGNILFAGDTATQNFKPFVEGIIPGIICGDIAGNLAAEHVLNKISLNGYKTRVYEKLGEHFELSDMVTNYMVDLFENQKKDRFLMTLGFFTDFFTTNESALENTNYEKLKHDLREYSKKV
jgi:digeranylgeranylglycerophospholipid reductase